AFNKNDIWISSGSQIAHWNGNIQDTTICNTSVSINAIWGSSSDNIYFVGNNGSIVHYDGSDFEKIESGTEVELTDIIGYGNDIWICGFTQTDETVIMKNTDNGFERWYSNPYNEYINYDNSKISGPIISIWTDSEKYLWAITYWGLYLIDSDDPYSFKIYSNINAWNGYIFSLSGNAKNDLFFCGDRTTIWHFNGVSNHYYEELKGDISLRKVKSSNEIVVIVGSDYATNKAIIIRGKRN
ncbi:MAG: hypothetical protein PF551_01605, partial [Candidatus Marinimicrobia bacterium]|nr:hypothetical protein [Candidatus Neomarinimicrobiota bacterium]